LRKTFGSKKQEVIEYWVMVA